MIKLISKIDAQRSEKEKKKTLMKMKTQFVQIRCHLLLLVNHVKCISSVSWGGFAWSMQKITEYLKLCKYLQSIGFLFSTLIFQLCFDVPRATCRRKREGSQMNLWNAMECLIFIGFDWMHSPIECNSSALSMYFVVVFKSLQLTVNSISSVYIFFFIFLNERQQFSRVIYSHRMHRTQPKRRNNKKISFIFSFVASECHAKRKRIEMHFSFEMKFKMCVSHEMWFSCSQIEWNEKKMKKKQIEFYFYAKWKWRKRQERKKKQHSAKAVVH